MRGMYSLGRRIEFHRMVQHCRMNQTSLGKIPFDFRVIFISVLFLRNLAVAQNHPGPHEARLKQVGKQRGEIASPQFAPASNAKTTPHHPENYGIPCEQAVTSEHASKPTEPCDRNNAHQCPVCGKTFQYHATLMWHQRSHTDDHDFQCTLCSNAYKYSGHLRGHMKAKHPNEFTGPCRASRKQVQESLGVGNPCSECNKCFKSWKGLQQHRQFVHKGSGLSDCEECGKTFSRKSNLRKHVRTVHENLGRFTCTECGKSLSGLFALKRHIK
ncbi:zinc finger protein 629, partial [Clonorchis sinensis]